MRFPKPNKFKAQRCEHDGEAFRSKLERDVYSQLQWLERGGLISNVRREQSIQLTPSIKHKLDFVVTDTKTGQDYGIEAKGATDASWSIKRRLYLDFGPFLVQVWRRLGKAVGIAETLPPGKYQWDKKGDINGFT